MARGPLGFPRLTNVGPLVQGPPRFSQEVSREEMTQMIQEIVDEEGIQPPDAEPGTDEFELVVDLLSVELFDSERKQNRFRACLQGSWSSGWSEGFDNATFPDVEDIEGEESTALEQLSLQATGCRSLVEGGTIEAPPG